MPEDDNLDLDDENEDESQLIRDLRKKARKAEKAELLETDNQRMARELAVYKAGLTDLNEDQMAALLAVQKDGDDPKELATRLGFVRTAPAEPDPDLAAHDRIAAAAGGVPSTPPNVTSEIRQMRRDAERGMGSAEEAVEKLQQLGVPTDWADIVSFSKGSGPVTTPNA